MRHALVVLQAMALIFASAAECRGAPEPPPSAASAAMTSLAIRSAVQPGQPDYAVNFRPSYGPPATPGWGLFAVVRGRSMNLYARSGWTDDRDAGPDQMEAGYGWRRSGLSAIIGYVQPDYGRPDGVPIRHGPSGIVGLNFTLYSR